MVSNILRDLARPFARAHAPQPTGPIVVLDDFFPNLYSGFRVAEYNAYLERFPHLVVRSSSPDFSTAHAIYARRYPHFASRVLPFDPAALDHARLAYFMFLHNAHAFLPFLTQAQLPFVFTLNPGGSFGLNDAKSDSMLDPVIASPLFRHVIVTQNITRTYLRDRGVPSEKITLIYGGVMNARYVDAPAPSRPYYPQKPLFDIAFIAHKYMPNGANKGFPEFCALASRFVDDRTIAWHVVGHDFDEGDWPTELARPQAFTFHGLLESTTTLYDFLLGIDIVVSPQQPFLLYPGNFDSLPTMGIAEASLQGAAMICSDVLKMNDRYREGAQIVIAPPEVDALFRAVADLKANPKRLQSLAKAGQRRSRELFSSTAQLRERVALLARFAAT